MRRSLWARSRAAGVLTLAASVVAMFCFVTASGVPASAAAPAACHTPVKIGVSDSSDAAAASAGVGYSKTTAIANYQAKEKQLYNVGVANLNKRGGLGGCPVSLVFFDYTTMSATESYDQVSQQECVDFAQDQHVFAAVPETAEQWDLVPCLAKAHIPVIISAQTVEGGLPTTSIDYNTGDAYSPSAISWDRLGGEINLFHTYGFFGSNAKVGIIEETDGRGVDQKVVKLWKSRLAALHVPVVSTFTGPRFDAYSDTGVFAQDMGNAILQFRAAGVDHVLFAPGAGGYLYFFQLAAQSQAYAPRIAIDTTDRPAQDIDPTATSTAGLMVVSWNAIDYSGQATVPSNPADPARTRCDNLYKGPAAADNIPVESMYGWCDTLSLLQAAVGTKGGRPSLTTFRTGLGHLGSSFQNAEGFGPTKFSTAVHDGGTEARVMEWNSSIKGLTYISPPVRVP
jgi:hypothetical protein